MGNCVVACGVNGEQSHDIIGEVLAVFGILIIISYHDIHCYTVDPNNVLITGNFKASCRIRQIYQKGQADPDNQRSEFYYTY